MPRRDLDEVIGGTLNGDSLSPSTFSGDTGSGEGRNGYTNPAPPVAAPTSTAPDRASTIAGYYNQYLRPRTNLQSDPGYLGWVNGSYSLPDVENYIRNSQEAREYSASGASGGGQSDDDWIRATMQKYGVDPSEFQYWQGIVRQYGGSVDRVGRDWLEDRIHRADSSADVRSGAISRVQHGGGPRQHQFDDPDAQRLEDMINAWLERLGMNPSRPELAGLMGALQNRSQTSEARAKELSDMYGTRARELRETPFSAGDEAVIRAKAFDQFERRRQETLKNAREGVYAKGFAPTSGLAQDAENQVNANFEQARSRTESDLLQSMMEEVQKRRDKAVGLDQLASEALNHGDETVLRYLSQLAGLEDSQIQNENNRYLQSIQAAGIPIDLASQRAGQAMQILSGGGGNASNPISSILAMLNLGQNNAGINAAGQNNNMAGLGIFASLLPYLLRNNSGSSSSYAGDWY